MKQLVLLVMASLALTTVPAMAQQRGTTAITLPGVKLERRNGWFGTQQNVYSDALGNRVEQKKGLFGSRRTNGQLLGNRIERDRWGTTVTDNQGNVVVKRRRGWFGAQDTVIDGNSVFERMKNVFGNGSPNPPAYTSPNNPYGNP